MSLLTRAGIIAAIGLFVVAGIVVVVFALGKPTAVRVSPETVAPAPAAGAKAVGEPGSDPLAIEIPGCVCHSDDPDLVAEHSAYRMSECFDCHQGGMPAMGR